MYLKLKIEMYLMYLSILRVLLHYILYSLEAWGW